MLVSGWLPIREPPGWLVRLPGIFRQSSVPAISTMFGGTSELGSVDLSGQTRQEADTHIATGLTHHSLHAGGPGRDGLGMLTVVSLLVVTFGTKGDLDASNCDSAHPKQALMGRWPLHGSTDPNSGRRPHSQLRPIQCSVARRSRDNYPPTPPVQTPPGSGALRLPANSTTNCSSRGSWALSKSS